MPVSSAALLLGILIESGPILAQTSVGSTRLAHSTRRDLLMRYDMELELSARSEDGAFQVLGTQECHWTGYVIGTGHADDVECIQMWVVDPPAKAPNQPVAGAVASVGGLLGV